MVRRQDVLGDLLSIERNRDLRVVEPWADHDVEHALDFALRLAVARQDELLRHACEGGCCDRDDEENENVTAYYFHISADIRIGSC